MNAWCHLVVLSAPVIALALAGCDRGPSAPAGQAPASQAPASQAQPEQPTPSAAVTTSEQPRELTAVGELKNVHFDLDRAQIRSREARLLQDNVRWLKSHRDAVLMIGGHADERGSEEYNMRLGERRADAVRKYLIGQGVEAGRITTSSHGEGRPVCNERTEACWGKNRRAEFQVKAR
jgi:peptidoglycan-associated lipoprotein